MPLTVTQLIANVNAALAVLENVEVEGEIDEFKIIHTKWVTFQLKDEESTVGCFMTVWQYKTAVEDGMLVRVKGHPTLRNKGFFSFVISSIQPSGEGALKRAFELLRQKLTDEGLFAPERKRVLPRFPQHIALITSREAAAYSDFLKVLKARHGGITVSLLHTQVQGEDAPRQIQSALEYANTNLDNLDIIVMVRGGGSLEDLQAFNDETIVRAVAASRTPTIVGIGHERDITLAELAADVRASTPSNAAELLIRSRDEVRLTLQQFRLNLIQSWRTALMHKAGRITRSVQILRSRATAPQQKVRLQLESLAATRQRINHTVAMYRENIARFRSNFQQEIRESIDERRATAQQLQRVLQSLSPERTLQRGYSITRNTRGSIIKTAAALALGQEIETQFGQGKTKSRVLGSDSQPTLI